MVYMIIEDFRGDAPAVYRRFRTEGRLMPDGLKYISSWITSDYSRCFQVMECEDRALLEQWMANWADLMKFEVIPVITSAEASATMAAKD
ncbi:MAG TPA: DUF3303 family protein [Gemmatimonadaceae bacterium]|nr:DUF3303 family protein [Gemmatimonadaceae bacterium]